MNFKWSKKLKGLYDPRFEHDACGFGFVCNVEGISSHQIIQKGLKVLKNLYHRGAVGSEPNSGDGAGVLVQIPHDFFKRELATRKIILPPSTRYGVGQFFFPPQKKYREVIKKEIVQEFYKNCLEIIAWRDVPVDNNELGETALAQEPFSEQLFIANNNLNEVEFEQKLYFIRKVIEKKITNLDLANKDYFFPVSLSCRTIVYKGQLTAIQMGSYFQDFKSQAFKSALIIVHSRFSTNTFPSWKLAHPFRIIAHNGEINTKRGNINWMRARESFLHSFVFSNNQIKAIQPIINEVNSDSMNFDSMLDFLIKSGKSLAESIMIMIPEAWENNQQMDERKKAFYRFYASFMEPWDGPAAIAFSDGRYVGGTLDRNGLRPSRYTLYTDNTLVMSSEGGVLDYPFSQVKLNKKLEPGKLLLIDLKAGRIISDEEVKREIVAKLPYSQWNKKISPLKSKLKKNSNSKRKNQFSLLPFAQLFGYSQEDYRIIISYMMNNGQEPVGSMGRDIPLAILSKKPILLFNYFYQLFAQVTNPPIDPIRERNFMSLKGYLGSQKNLFALNPQYQPNHLIEIETPILSLEELLQIKKSRQIPLRCKTIFSTYLLKEGLQKALERVLKEVELAVRQGNEIIIISDRDVSREKMYIPSLLVTSAVHQHLVRKKIRSQCGLVIESGEVREVHHFALLLGYGANAIVPYLVYESINWLLQEKLIHENMSLAKAQENYIQAVNKGLLKIISKMGISTIRSYIGAQIFEAVGISEKVIHRYFTGTSSRIGGIGLNLIEKDYLVHFNQSFINPAQNLTSLIPGGEYQWRLRGEKHLFNPQTVHLLQHSCRTNNYELFQEYSQKINQQNENIYTLRGLLEFTNLKPIPLKLVEPKEKIFKRFVTGAMSFGSISWEAHTTLAKAMNRIGGKSNTGEGGEDPQRFIVNPNQDSMRSAIKQIASGRFGVTAHYLVNADEIQIKIAQGAKPGEGGQLPGYKVDAVIAKVRHSTPGVGLISPPPHHDIYSIEDLAQLIYDLKCINPQAKVNVKLVASVGVGTIATGVVKGYADIVTIAGFDGGTGASPIGSIKHTGLPWELGLSETHQTLVLNNLRNRARLQTDGQIKTAYDVVVATLLGAEEWGVATAALVVMGCVIMRKCHLNTCPVGIATQRNELRKLFQGEVDHLVNFFTFLAEDVRKIMAKLGFRTIEEMVGRTDKLKLKNNIDYQKHPKLKKINLEKILFQYKPEKLSQQFCCIPQPKIEQGNIDLNYLSKIKNALKKKKKITIHQEVKNVHRAIGSLVSHEVTRIVGDRGLPHNSINFNLRGSAGQSFAAFACKGLNFHLKGEANDYFAKGLSGANITLTFPPEAKLSLQENIIVGNVAFYGATSGVAYLGGLAGERFAVRNSGAEIVVEGVGAHGLEYMTGGKVIILGSIGQNFAAGMSGGIAYILNNKNNRAKINNNLIVIEKVVNKEDKLFFYKKLSRHYRLTKSLQAKKIIKNFELEIKNYRKLIPLEYKRVVYQLQEKASQKKLQKRKLILLKK